MMSDRPWYPFYPKDYQMKTLGLDAHEHAAYRTMIDLCWQHRTGCISGNMVELKKTLQRLIVNFHGITFNRVVPKLLKEYFVKREDGNFYHPRVEEELRKWREISEKSERIARERWSGSNKNNDLGHATHTHTHINKASLPLGRDTVLFPPKLRTWEDKPLTPDPRNEGPIVISEALVAHEASTRPVPSGGSLATALCGERAREPPIAASSPSNTTRAEYDALLEARRKKQADG
jgi:uncharacterized protein YdaU (DUF1376 family)